MNASAGTSLAGHVESALALRLLRAFHESLGWEFIIPDAVYAELARRRVPPELAAFPGDGAARTGACGTRPVPRRGPAGARAAKVRYA